MRRVSSSNVLVVSPFEVAWVSDESSALSGNAGHISFEARGENDATVILRAVPGTSKRIQQQLTHSTREADSNDLYEPHYTVIFGSHQNNCLKIERNSQECFRWENAARVSGSKFTPCWISFDRGKFSMGAGRPGCGTVYTWEDPTPIQDVKHVGLGSWNTYVCFKNIKIQPMVGPGRPSREDSDQTDGDASNVPSLSALCKKAALSCMTPANICTSLAHVEMLSPELDDIAPQLVSYLAEHLEEVLRLDSDTFCGLDADLLRELVGHPHLVCRESVVLNAVLVWALGSSNDLQTGDCLLQQDSRDVDSLLAFIRFPLMAPDELKSLRDSQVCRHMPFLADCAEAGMRGQMVPQPDTQERQAFQRLYTPACTQLMFVCSGDYNGVIHWLGTTYGTQEFISPISSGMVQVDASSPNCKHTDPRSLTNLSFFRLNFAGPGKSGTWWRLNLGKQHRCIVNYYTIRHDHSADYPRHWSLQGSLDGERWVDLRKHENDVSINRSGQCASWPVRSHASALPYQMFRLLLTGPNTSLAGNRMTFHLSMLELYGQFFCLK